MTKYFDNYNTYHDVNNTRLQVETDPPVGVLPNLVKNAGGEKGAWFYNTPVAGHTMSGGSELTYSATAGAAYFYTSQMPVTPGEYVAARWDDLSLTYATEQAVVTNLITNPTFELNTATYAVGSGSSSIVRMTGGYGRPPGTAALIINCQSGVNAKSYVNGPTITGIVPGKTYTLTAGFYYPYPTYGGGAMLRWKNSGGTQIGADQVLNWTIPSGFGFNAHLTPVTAPTGAASVSLFFFVNPPPGGWVLDDLWELDTVGFYDGVVTGDYFDGLTADTTKYDYAWTATAHASTSTRTFLNVGYKTRIEWVDANGVVTGSTQTSLTTTHGATYFYSAIVVPAGAVYARLRFDFYNTNGGNPGYALTFALNNVMFTHAATSAELTTFDFSQPFYWLDILGPTHTIGIDREALNLGTWSCVILDHDLDPSQGAAIRPGKLVRLQTTVDATNWTNVYEGKITNAKVTYPVDMKKSVNTLVLDTPRIQISASDAVSDLGYASPQAMDIAYLPYLLEGHDVPWVVNGSGNQTAAGVVRSINQNAKMIDQIALARDSQFGYAWVNRDNTLIVNEPAFMDNTVKWTISSDAGSPVSYLGDIDADFDTASAVNYVTVKYLRLNGDESVEEPHGPYLDANSVKEWGILAKEFVWQGPSSATEADIAAMAATVLAANGTPSFKVNSMTVAVQDAPTFAFATGVDLYDLVHVKHLDKFEGDLRVTGIKHTISVDRWFVTLTFETDGSVASPQELPSPGNTPSGVQEGVWIQVGDTGAPTFGSGWGSRGGWGPVAFRRDGNRVTLRGLANGPAVSAGAQSIAIFTLPPGYRPDATGGLHFTIPAQVNTDARIQVTSAGVVNLNYTAASAGAGFWWGLDGISFVGASL